MEFILQSQARAEVRMEKSDARVAAMEKRLDKRMDAIARLLQQGVRSLVKIHAEVGGIAKAQKRSDAKFAELAQAQRELAEAQKATDRSLKNLIDHLRTGRNGRSGH